MGRNRPLTLSDTGSRVATFQSGEVFIHKGKYLLIIDGFVPGTSFVATFDVECRLPHEAAGEFHVLETFTDTATFKVGEVPADCFMRINISSWTSAAVRGQIAQD